MRTPIRLVLATATSVALLTSTATAAAHAASPASPGADRPAAQASSYAWTPIPTGSGERFRGLSPVSRDVAWISGTNGTVLRTTDGGATWSDVSPQGLGTEALQFRDIEAFSADRAVVLSIGEGEDSRILVTDDGGATWTETFRNEEPTAFYDCMAFTTPRHGVAMSDPVDGRFRLVETDDAGRTWSVVDPAGMPPANNEYGFAASGTCLTAGAGPRLYLGSGGNDPARVFTSQDGGSTWTVADTPIRGGAAAGIFSVRFDGPLHGVAVGGDFLDPTSATGNAAWTADGGVTWHAPATNPTGYRSGSDWVPGTRATVIAVGPSGSDVSTDGGRSWSAFDSGSYDSVECTRDGACWASGEQGRVAVLTR